MLFRKYWLTFDDASLMFYLYVDASPQWKGVELFCASFDMVMNSVSEFFERRLFVQISIGSIPHTPEHW
jgi:hypothetical protein